MDGTAKNSIHGPFGAAGQETPGPGASWGLETSMSVGHLSTQVSFPESRALRHCPAGVSKSTALYGRRAAQTLQLKGGGSTTSRRVLVEPL